MKKRLIAGVLVVALIGSVGAVAAFASDKGATEGRGHPGQRGEKPEGFRKGFSEVDKAQMEVAMAEYKEKHDAFVDSLTAEQKALYEAMRPAAPAEGQRPEKSAGGQRPEKSADGQRPEKPDDSAMNEAQEAFIASLADEQKAAFDELMGSMNRGFRGNKAGVPK